MLWNEEGGRVSFATTICICFLPLKRQLWVLSLDQRNIKGHVRAAVVQSYTGLVVTGALGKSSHDKKGLPKEMKKK